MSHFDDSFKIYVDQLHSGETKEIKEVFAPDFLGVDEPELKFIEPVKLFGSAYLADKELVLHLDIFAVAEIPCSICNEFVKCRISLHGLYHSVPVNDVKGAIFDLREVLRDNILLETPSFAECEGECPKRKEIAVYLTKESDGNPSSSENEKGHGYYPFAGLK